MSRTYTYYLAVLDGVVCLYFIIHLFFFPQARTLQNDVVQGVLIGIGLAFITAQAYARIKAVKVNGSVDIYIQNTAPAGNESNWLPAPAGKFILWFRVYIPGAAILDGTYKLPPVVKTK